MKTTLVKLLLLAVYAANAVAEEPGHGPEATDVNVTVGTPDGKYQFSPNKLSFERGKYYRLIVHNASPEAHYFTSDAFATHIFTRKVEVMGADGKVIAEVHGPVNDLDLEAGATVAWYFYPMTNGDNLPLFCHKEGHAAKGMMGTISIVGPPPFAK